VRYNDVQGNAHAGLRIAPNQTIPADVSCNYWGSATGPSGIGPGEGDAIVVEPGAPAPQVPAIRDILDRAEILAGLLGHPARVVPF
jgi:hypothetical protein